MIYGDKKDATLISLDPKELERLVQKKAFFATLLDLELSGTKHRVLPRDVQFDPVYDRIVHADFQRINKDAKIHVNVPVVVTILGSFIMGLLAAFFLSLGSGKRRAAGRKRVESGAAPAEVPGEPAAGRGDASAEGKGGASGLPPADSAPKSGRKRSGKPAAPRR